MCASGVSSCEPEVYSDDGVNPLDRFVVGGVQFDRPIAVQFRAFGFHHDRPPF